MSSIPESTPAVMTAPLTLVLRLVVVGFGEIPQYAHEPQRDPAGDPKRTSEGNKVNMKLAPWIDHNTTLLCRSKVRSRFLSSFSDPMQYTLMLFFGQVIIF